MTDKGFSRDFVSTEESLLERAEREREERLQRAKEAAEEALQGGSSSQYYYYNNNIDHDTGRAHKMWPPEDGERILEAYTDNVAETMTLAVARMIEGAFDAGLTVDEIILAIEETGLAPRPSPRYLKAILKNWMANGRCIAQVRFYTAPNDSRLAWWRQKR